MNKTITYKKVQNFIDKDIKPRIDYTDPSHNDPFTTEYANMVANQYVRFVYADLGLIIKPTKRVIMNKCLGFLLRLKTSAKRFMRVNPSYRYHEYAERNFKVRTIEENIKMFQCWFVDEFKYEVGIE